MAQAYVNIEDAFQAVAAEAIGVCALVSIHGDGLAYNANAITGVTQDIPAAGVTETTLAVGDTAEIKRDGKVAGATGLTPGQWIYLAETDGGITQTAPSDSGDAVQVVGYAISTTEWMLQIQPHALVS